MTSFSESEVEQLALDWLEGLGWATAYGPDISDAERDSYDQVVLEQRLAEPSSFHTECGTVTRTGDCVNLVGGRGKGTDLSSQPHWVPAFAGTTM